MHVDLVNKSITKGRKGKKVECVLQRSGKKGERLDDRFDYLQRILERIGFRMITLEKGECSVPVLRPSHPHFGILTSFMHGLTRRFVTITMKRYDSSKTIQR